MSKDLYYLAGGAYTRLVLTPDKRLPDALKRAITLMVFSKDPEIRNFDGQSIVLAFPKATTAGFDSIVFNLTQAAKRIEQLLQTTNPEVTRVYFDSASIDSTLQITLNVETTSNNTQTAVVYV